MSWWIWAAAGLVLLVLELLTPGGFFIVFFGGSAIIVGALTATGYLPALWLQGLVFAVLALVLLVFFRQKLLALIGPIPANKVDSMIGEAAVAAEEIGVQAIGKVELRGSSWSAKNIGEAPISKGQRCKVEQVDGLTLSVKI
jgi:inner membrane protein